MRYLYEYLALLLVSAILAPITLLPIVEVMGEAIDGSRERFLSLSPRLIPSDFPALLVFLLWLSLAIPIFLIGR